MKITSKEILLLLTLVSLFLLLNSATVWKAMYPIHYQEEVKTASRQYDVDPYLILSIIQIESNFNHNRISKKGAVGLMQLMPDTARWVIEQAGFPEESIYNLDQPVINVHLGSWYLSFLDRKFNGNETAVVAAYNAGPGNVERWLSEGTWDGRMETIEHIPYGETRHYLHRVFYYYGRYIEIYEDEFSEEVPMAP
ncbi:MAG: lytic transglycosylase domain-containing protein [Bacillaceae bacterium]|nr:lytic transglycosylase domain-containing protein [Bacillaceae bacterium]